MNRHSFRGFTTIGAVTLNRLGDKNLQFRVEVFNVFNVRIYGAPETDPRSPNFGIVDAASQVNFPRTIQLGARLQF